MQGLLKKNEKKLARSYNFAFRYIDDVMSPNNSKFCDFVDHIYSIDLEIKDTTDTALFASYLNIQLEILQLQSIKNETLRQKSCFQFPH